MQPTIQGSNANSAPATTIPHYSILLQWEPVGQVYVVSIPEFDAIPGWHIHTHGTTRQEALAHAQEMLEGLFSVAPDQDFHPPPPTYFDISD